MHPFPHHYQAQAEAAASGPVRVSTQAAPDLQTTAPPEFDGPAGYWSPETLLVASVADCFILSFRAVARASKLEWRSLSVDVEGVLDRVDGVTRFVSFTVVPRLAICAADREHLAGSVLEKAKRTCLVTNSLNAECHLQPQVTVVACEGVVAAA
jgi:organic hydroperoxide reductase OsmC/OhrA